MFFRSAPPSRREAAASIRVSPWSVTAGRAAGGRAAAGRVAAGRAAAGRAAAERPWAGGHGTGVTATITSGLERVLPRADDPWGCRVVSSAARYRQEQPRTQRGVRPPLIRAHNGAQGARRVGRSTWNAQRESSQDAPGSRLTVSRGTSKPRELPQPDRCEQGLHHRHLTPSMVRAGNHQPYEVRSLTTKVRSSFLRVQAARGEDEPLGIAEQRYDVGDVLPGASAFPFHADRAGPPQPLPEIAREEVAFCSGTPHRSPAADDPCGWASPNTPDRHASSPSVHHVDPRAAVRKPEYDDNAGAVRWYARPVRDPSSRCTGVDQL
ncbi:hypothetical protein JOE58_002540 [Curtobacterium luteum]|uniref:Uncharacterized protein n=1 Tax=Curtobacterium luteum TaxID=33881 RepID=A0ABS2RW93_9MICO|nr:hypothetical protein [Curtobacterium luteum]